MSPPTTAESPSGDDDRLGEHHLPLLRRPGPAGDRHHAPVGWVSSWYFLRYMDPHNDKALASQEALRLLGPGGLVQRRNGAHHPPSALLPVLA